MSVRNCLDCLKGREKTSWTGRHHSLVLGPQLSKSRGSSLILSTYKFLFALDYRCGTSGCFSLLSLGLPCNDGLFPTIVTKINSFPPKLLLSGYSFFLNKVVFISIALSYMCVSVRGYVHRSAGIQRPVVLDVPGARVTGDYEPPDVVLWLELFGLLKKQYVCLNTELSIQPQPRYFYHSNRN